MICQYWHIAETPAMTDRRRHLVNQRMQLPEVDFELEQFEVQLLEHPADAPALDEPDLKRVQAEHLAYLFAEQAAGRLAMAGAIVDHPSIVGLGLWRTGSTADAEARAAADPGVVAGLYTSRFLTWVVPKGVLTFAAPPAPQEA
jgi:uncharacterized protein YciI